MGDPMKVRATAEADGKVLVKVLMSHMMETGQRKDKDGNKIPAFFIQTISVKLNDKLALTCEWGPAVSKNPFLGFRLSNAKKGDKVVVSWVDSKGDTRSDEGVVG